MANDEQANDEIEIAETTTTELIDVDGDGAPDVVQQTTTTAIDVDGDGVPDILEQSTATAADLDGDGTISEDEVEIEETVAVRADLLEDDAE